MIDPQEVIQRYTPEEICQGAEDYFASIPDTTYLERKPFFDGAMAGETLYRFGLALKHLKLSPGMTLLDFGSGTCWTSKYLIQLGCQVTACDPSPTALEIGRNVVEKSTLADTERFTTLPFRGRSIDAPDNSFDRVLCFDSFHHIPNWQEVLGEMYRVLKPGGLITFAEPGYGHSKAATSQFEMKRSVVLENDIHIPEIEKVALKLGFKNLRWQAVISRDYESRKFKDLVTGKWWSSSYRRMARSCISALKDALSHTSIFSLSKGNLKIDSRQMRFLAAQISSAPTSQPFAENREISISVKVKNIAASTWLSENEDECGVVYLGCHRLNEHGSIAQEDVARAKIDRDMEKGHEAVITLVFPPHPKGKHDYILDLVSERVSWFELANCKGHQTHTLSFTVQ
ncbi:MAG: methyltransferase domain-containing protein [Verrucomicrobiota bacterium]